MSAPALPTKASAAFVDVPYDHAASVAETHERPKIHVSRWSDGRLSVDLRWLGGNVTGEALVMRMLAPCSMGLGGIQITVWAPDEFSSWLGLSADECRRIIGDQSSKAQLALCGRSAA